MKRLDHPHIVRLFEIYEDDKRYYLAMELCTGGELFDELAKQERFDEETSSIYCQ
jgi:calcium-dependent protein kinase